MSRYTALSLIPLPRVGATAAVALGAQVLSAADGQKKAKTFPKELLKPADILAEKHALLAEAVSTQVVAPEATDDALVVPLDQNIDSTWSASDLRLQGMARLPDEPKAGEAAALRARLFPDGLKFLNKPYKEEWAESKARLDRIDAENLGPALDRLCGKEFLPAIRKAHQAYGDALGLSAPGAAPTLDEAPLRGPLDAFMLALRRFVTKVVALGDDDTPEGAALMNALLWPLDTWAPPAAKRAPATPAEPTSQWGDAAPDIGVPAVPTPEAAKPGSANPEPATPTGTTLPVTAPAPASPAPNAPAKPRRR